MATTDTPRDREQTRVYLIKAAQLIKKPVCLDGVDALVDDIMNGGSFIDAVHSLVAETEYWD